MRSDISKLKFTTRDTRPGPHLDLVRALLVLLHSLETGALHCLHRLSMAHATVLGRTNLDSSLVRDSGELHYLHRSLRYSEPDGVLVSSL